MSHRNRSIKGNSGFTLVEMLVAVALVVLMMSLFATIFQFATKAMATQKGTAENDQRVRLVLTLLRNDLKNRTMLDVLPFRAYNDDMNDVGYDPGNRQGYLYISENDPDDGTDDNIQLTVALTSADDVFYGRTPTLTTNGIANDPNQPEYDDGNVVANTVGSSQRAEVSYFLRKGVLYRRVLLIRSPIAPATPTDGVPQYGSTGTGGPIPLTQYLASGANGTANFWTDFDYSAYYDPSTALPVFHFVKSLDNAAGGVIYLLGKPNFRFGFDQATGLPREFTTTSINGATAGPRYFGRFTHEETSYYIAGGNPLVSFGYPARVAPPESPNPFNVTTALTFNESTGKINEYTGGSRIAEDILMTNVQAFDIKVWDDAASYGPDLRPGIAGVDDDGVGGTDDIGELGWPGSDDGDFRDVGHNGFIVGGVDQAFYSATSNYFRNTQSTAYTPVHPVKAGTRQYRFDTWNPNVNLAAPATATPPFDPPPFRAPDAVNGATTLRRPLKAIQILVRIYDPTSQQLRDVTFVQSLTDY